MRRLDAPLAAVETVALGLWAGALVAFAAFFAPAAFATLGARDVAAFAALIAGQIGSLSAFGLVCAIVALLALAVRRQTGTALRPIVVRAALVAAALLFVAVEQAAIVPAMRGTPPGTPAYRTLHGRSSAVYGAATLCVVAALALAGAGAGASRR